MCEEIMHPGTELNEAELESASGGEQVEYTQASLEQARLCGNCHDADPSKLNCAHGADLKSYIMANGHRSVPFHQKCPYYKS